MNGEQLNRAQAIFEEAVDLPASQRGPLLDDRCGDDQELRTFVERLLSSHDRGLDDFLQTPEIEIARLLRGRDTQRDGRCE
jgi:hypothetical protein